MNATGVLRIVRCHTSARPPGSPTSPLRRARRFALAPVSRARPGPGPGPQGAAAGCSRAHTGEAGGGERQEGGGGECAPADGFLELAAVEGQRPGEGGRESRARALSAGAAKEGPAGRLGGSGAAPPGPRVLVVAVVPKLSVHREQQRHHVHLPPGPPQGGGGQAAAAARAMGPGCGGGCGRRRTESSWSYMPRMLVQTTCRRDAGRGQRGRGLSAQRRLRGAAKGTISDAAKAAELTLQKCWRC
jgi:hypothetical protein